VTNPSAGSLLAKLTAEIGAAMKSGDALRLSVLRMLKTALMNEKISLKRELTEAEELGVVSRLVKQRQEAALSFREAKREELALKEEQELKFLQEFLPSQLAPAEISSLIEAAIKESQACGPNDLGKVMKLVSPQVKGRADGKLVSQMVQQRLSSS